MHFLLFVLASAMAAGPLERLLRASVVDLGMADGSEGMSVRWLGRKGRDDVAGMVQ